MKFKGGSTRLESEWRDALHPHLKTLVIEFSLWSERQNLPEPVITMLVRTKAEQVAIYTKFWLKLMRAMERGERYRQIDPEDDGTFRPLNGAELAQARVVVARVNEEITKGERAVGVTLGEDARAGLTRDVLDRLAAARFTWHWCACAADLRTNHYSGEQLEHVRTFFEARCQKPQWELLIHDVTAPHLHVARRDFGWRAKLLESPADA